MKNNKLKSLFMIIQIGSWGLALSVLGSLLGSAGNYIMLLSIGKVSETVLLQADKQIFDPSPFYLIGGIVLLMMPLLILFQTMYLLGGQVAEKNLMTRLLDTITKAKYSFIEHSGSVMNLLTSDASVINNFYFQGINNNILSNLITGCASLLTCFIIDYRFGLVALTLGILSMIFGLLPSKSIQKEFAVLKEHNKEATTAFSEVLSNEEFYRIHALTQEGVDKLDSKNSNVQRTNLILAKKNNLINTLGSSFNFLTTTLFLLIGIILSKNSTLDFSKVVLLIPMQIAISGMFTRLPLSINYLNDVISSSEIIQQFIESEAEPSAPSKPTQNLTDSAIVLKHLNFSYKDGQKVLDDINLDIKVGQKVGIVGGSGSGKSTLIKLLLGLYQADSGLIISNGFDHSTSSLEDIRSQYAYLQQDSPLFNITIGENIRLGNLNSSQDELIHASKASNIYDFIESLDYKFDSKIGDDSKSISGGQKQRIALARAFVSKAPILLMDEPTSALDYQSQDAISKSITNIKGQKTLVIVAHKLETIIDSDVIIVMDHGKIVEVGSHPELLKNKSYYYNLYTQNN